MPQTPHNILENPLGRIEHFHCGEISVDCSAKVMMMSPAILSASQHHCCSSIQSSEGDVADFSDLFHYEDAVISLYSKGNFLTKHVNSMNGGKPPNPHSSLRSEFPYNDKLVCLHGSGSRRASGASFNDFCTKINVGFPIGITKYSDEKICSVLRFPYAAPAILPETQRGLIQAVIV
ncbi:predicted protein [Botrytis cinerea T4]|uniref:Uncharacterized protein n=1 Tax=Botryotinia fuckeliana (strain T4) TaxID=999810 RepID=G2YLA9_BOTF4|nr:predicted protein [Botrytis cinerea T4]